MIVKIGKGYHKYEIMKRLREIIYNNIVEILNKPKIKIPQFNMK